MSDKKEQPQAAETPKDSYTNVSGRMQSAPDGTDWPDMTARDLTGAEAASYVAYGYAVRTPAAPAAGQADSSPRTPRTKGGEAQ